MTRRALTHFPREIGFDFGDANHLPIVPRLAENPTDTSPSATVQPPVPGDAGKKQKTK